jgi:hypothetical protein
MKTPKMVIEEHALFLTVRRVIDHGKTCLIIVSTTDNFVPSALEKNSLQVHANGGQKE